MTADFTPANVGNTLVAAENRGAADKIALTNAVRALTFVKLKGTNDKSRGKIVGRKGVGSVSALAFCVSGVGFCKSEGAIVVCCGAAAAKTMQEVVDEIASLVERLRTPPYDADEPALHLEGALTAASAAGLIAARESRQVVVRDPTQIALDGKAGSRALAQLRVRCRRPLRIIAATIASLAPDRSFEPRAFADAVAHATGLPTFDVYASAQAA